MVFELMIPLSRIRIERRAAFVPKITVHVQTKLIISIINQSIIVAFRGAINQTIINNAASVPGTKRVIYPILGP